MSFTWLKKLLGFATNLRLGGKLGKVLDAGREAGLWREKNGLSKKK